MKRLLLLACIVCLLGSHSLAAEEAARPNIVVILVDDMGYSDIGCYGSEIPTPHLDGLAAKGLRFTQFYNTGRCCPTRASLLTGLYPHQAGVGHMTADRGPKHPAYRGHLNDRCVTIGRVLSDAGYFTAVTGKWHIGHSDPSMWPVPRGFDRFFGVPEGGGFYFKLKPGRTVALNNEVMYSVDKQTPDGWYTTDAWTEWGIRFIDEARKEGKPWFLYLAHNAPHFPLQAPPEDIARFRGKYMAGWDKLREARHRRQIEMGLFDKAWPMSPRPKNMPAWNELDNQQRDRFDHIMAIYAATIYRMDRSVGTLVSALRERDMLDNTLILFLSDNGGNAESGPNGRLDGDPPGSAKSNVFCGQCWATHQNTPLRRYKHYNHEGGSATPLIAYWPAGIKAQGELRHQPGHVIDIMATCVDLARATYPEKLDGQAIQPMEGRSLVPAFANRPLQREALYWEHEGNRAVRVGDWKLVAIKGGPWELYDLKADRTELNDLSAEMPDKVNALSTLWNAWADRANVELPTGAKRKGTAAKKRPQ